MSNVNSIGAGRDVSCTDSRKTGRFVTGARLVAEAAYRRVTTPRGTLRGGEEEANYGIDLADLIGSNTTALSAAMLPGQIRAELAKDERIETTDVNVVTTVAGPAVSFNITISCTTAAGPFVLSLLASAVSVELLGITA